MSDDKSGQGKKVLKEMGVNGDLHFNPILRALHPLLKSSVVEDSEEKEKIYEENTSLSNKNMVLGKKNIGRVYTSLYRALFGGEILLENVNYIDELSAASTEFFRPDLIRMNDPVYGRVPVEIKSSCMRYDSFDNPSSQIENTVSHCVKWAIHGHENCLAEHAFFKYGDRNLKGVNKLTRKKMVETLCNSKLELLIAPLNLFLFMALNARKRDRDKRNSTSGIIEPYHIIRGGFFTKLCEGPKRLEELIEEYSDSRITHPDAQKDLFLDRLNFLQCDSPPIIVNYWGSQFEIPPFRISKYFFDQEGFESFKNRLAENHVRIIELMELRNKYLDYISEKEAREHQKFLSDVFGDLEELRFLAREEGISLQLAYKVYGDPGKIKTKKPARESSKEYKEVIPF